MHGQWVWTARDRELHAAARVAAPELQAAVLSGTIECDDRALRTSRGLSPAFSGTDAHALVVRLSDSLHGCVERLATEELGAALDRELERLLAEARATGARFGEVQIDYDAPVAKLARYAEVLGFLRSRSLRDLELWITSLPAHVRVPEYGELFRERVSGHILQLFDTGLRCDVRQAEALRSALAARGVPFRLGLGAFERKGARADASHACWVALTRA
ncbi:MAG TPA: DUF3142 domain-containing protein, partial [Polyangiaceae bacterium]